MNHRNKLISTTIMMIIVTFCEAAFSFENVLQSVLLLHKYNSPNGQSHEDDKLGERLPKINRESLWHREDNESIIFPTPSTDKIKNYLQNINDLNTKLTETGDNKLYQNIKIDLAYLNLITFFFYQNCRYEMCISSGGYINENPFSHENLLQYLNRANSHLKDIILYSTSISNNTNTNDVNNIYNITNDTSFTLLTKSSIFINLYFLAYITEIELFIATNSYTLKQSNINSITPSLTNFDNRTWHWLNELWLRYCTKRDLSHNIIIIRSKSNLPGIPEYTPTDRYLYDLYELYLKYYLIYKFSQKGDSFTLLDDFKIRTVFNRLAQLNYSLYSSQFNYFNEYLMETYQDKGNTEFIPALFLARRNSKVAKNIEDIKFRNTFFSFFKIFYDISAQNIKYNIPYRSRIYNELIHDGLDVKSLSLMIKIFEEYGHRTFKLEHERLNNLEFSKSSNFIVALLLANILERKRLSGLDQDSGRYSKIADQISSNYPVEDDVYWQLIAIINYNLATFFAKQTSGSSEELAMFYAHQAFKCSLEHFATLNSNQINRFYDNGLSVDCLNLFITFRDRYITTKYTKIPSVNIASSIVLKAQNRK